MKNLVDLNCDMGEGFGAWRLGESLDEHLMGLISSANVAAGFHAGDPHLIAQTVVLAKQHGVGLGAHPGYHDLKGFGRRYITMNTDELVHDVVYQVGAIREFGALHGVPLQHVKLHGALYMEAARNEELSRRIIDALKKTSPDGIVFCMGISATYRVAKQCGYPVVREFYADRDYDSTGSIVFKRSVSRLDPHAVAQKCVRACKEGTVATVDGNDIEIDFESICFHSDTPGSCEIGQAIQTAFKAENITIAPAIEVLNREK